MSKSYFLRFGTGDPRTLTGLSPTFLVWMSPAGATFAPPAISELPGTGIYSFPWGTTTYIGFLADAATTSPGADARYVVGAVDPVDRMDEVGTSLIALGNSHFAQGVSIIAQNVSILAQGVTNIALGTTNAALNTTLVGYGVSAFAQGSTLFGFGVSLSAQGLTISGQATTMSAQNLTLSGIGTTLVGYGVSAFAEGSTLTGYAASIYAGQVTLTGIGLTLGTLDARIGTTLSTFGDSSTDPGTLYGHLKRIQEFQEGDATFTKSTGAWAVKSRGGTLIASKTLSNSSSQVTKD